jgi:polyphosphate kinase
MRKAKPTPPTKPSRPRFINRELSWLEFDQRVLDEALDPGTPLLERVKSIPQRLE